MKLKSFLFGATTIPSNTTVMGRISLESAAVVNRRVMLSTNSEDLKIQKYIDIPTGQTYVDVPVVSTVLELNRDYVIQAQIENVNIKVTLTAVPSQLASITFDPAEVDSQGAADMTVTLNNVAEQGGATIELSEFNNEPGNQLLLPALPVSLLIPEGDVSATISVVVARVYNDTSTQVIAKYRGATVAQWLYIIGEGSTR